MSFRGDRRIDGDKDARVVKEEVKKNAREEGRREGERFPRFESEEQQSFLMKNNVPGKGKIFPLNREFSRQVFPLLCFLSTGIAPHFSPNLPLFLPKR